MVSPVDIDNVNIDNVNIDNEGTRTTLVLQRKILESTGKYRCGIDTPSIIGNRTFRSSVIISHCCNADRRHQ